MYTKGEWTVNKEKSFEGNEQFVIRTYPEPTRIQRVADVFTEANAQLIAQAPRMYELTILYSLFKTSQAVRLLFCIF